MKEFVYLQEIPYFPSLTEMYCELDEFIEKIIKMMRISK